MTLPNTLKSGEPETGLLPLRKRWKNEARKAAKVIESSTVSGKVPSEGVVVKRSERYVR